MNVNETLSGLPFAVPERSGGGPRPTQSRRRASMRAGFMLAAGILFISCAAEPRFNRGEAKWEPLLGQRITVEGKAITSEKIGALVETDGGERIWIDKLVGWPRTLYGRPVADLRVRVQGVVIKRRDLPGVFIEYPGDPPSGGIPVPPGTDLDKARTRYLLHDPSWEILWEEAGAAEPPQTAVAPEAVHWGEPSCGGLALGIALESNLPGRAIRYQLALSNRSTSPRRLTVFATLPGLYRLRAIGLQGDKKASAPALYGGLLVSSDFTITETLGPGEVIVRRADPAEFRGRLSGQGTLHLVFSTVQEGRVLGPAVEPETSENWCHVRSAEVPVEFYVGAEK